MSQPITCSSVTLPSGLVLQHTGPQLTRHQPLPTLFYFALSGEESLCKDPFNQPIQFLSHTPIRAFSATLPGHNLGLSPDEAMLWWGTQFAAQNDIIRPFVQEITHAIHFLVSEGLAAAPVAVAGLSRGGFIATHVAALSPHVRYLLGFAPLTDPTRTEAFKNTEGHLLLDSLKLSHLTKILATKELRFYMGNHDELVHTRSCFDLISDIASYAWEERLRPPAGEMIIFPSQGRQGHGTPPHIFQEGANWLLKKLIERK